MIHLNPHHVAGICLVLVVACSFLAWVSYRIGRAIERDARSVPGMLP